MSTNLILGLGFVLLFIILMLIVYWFAKKFQSLAKPPENNQQPFLLLQQQINEMSKAMDGRLSDANRSSQQQYGVNLRLIQDVTEKLSKLEETNKNVAGFAEQLQDLQDILKNPKQRGILGEYFLENVLKNVLPPSTFEMQYKFKDGVIVDAAIFIKTKIVPIDSKFSLENYTRILNEREPKAKEELEKQFKLDLKNRIDETAKYIRPDEGTMDFAFMFIPSEAIYYDLLINQVGAVKINTRDLIEYAFKERHVIIVSPTSFFAYLQTVLQGLRALQIEESAKEIRKNVELLQKHLLSYNEYLQKLGNHLGTTVNTYNAAYTEFKKMDKDVLRINGGESGIEPIQLDRPKNE